MIVLSNYSIFYAFTSLSPLSVISLFSSRETNFSSLKNKVISDEIPHLYMYRAINTLHELELC